MCLWKTYHIIAYTHIYCRLINKDASRTYTHTYTHIHTPTPTPTPTPGLTAVVIIMDTEYFKWTQGTGCHSLLYSDGCGENRHSLYEMFSCQALITLAFHNEIRLQIRSNNISGQIVFIAFISISIIACLWSVSRFITIVLFFYLCKWDNNVYVWFEYKSGFK